MTEEVRFIRGNDRISQLAQRPGLADGVAQVRRDMEDADRTYAMGLAALRGMSVDDGAMIATSFPNFRALMEGMGAKIG